MSTARRLARAAALIAASLVYACASAPEPSEADRAARAMVEKLQLGENLVPVGYMVSVHTTTYRVLVEMVGSEATRALVRQELSRAAPKYEQQWKANLAAVYAESFSADALRSLAEEQRASPYAAELVARRDVILRGMQAKSGGLLQHFVAEALSASLSRAQEGK